MLKVFYGAFIAVLLSVPVSVQAGEISGGISPEAAQPAVNMPTSKNALKRSLPSRDEGITISPFSLTDGGRNEATVIEVTEESLFSGKYKEGDKVSDLPGPGHKEIPQ